MTHGIYRDINGNDVRGPYVGDNAGIQVEAYFNDALHTCYIVNQKGGRQYQVQDIMSGDQAKCKLVDVLGTENNTMTLVGYLASSVPVGNTQPDGSPIVLNKLQKRLAIDWSGNRYTWVLENDSSMDYIALTPLD